VTGMGIVCPLGIGVEATWQAIMSCRSGVGPITLFDASTFPTRIAAEVRDFDFAKLIEGEGPYEHLGRATGFALVAAQEAAKDARLTPEVVPPERLGVYLGSGEGGLDFFNFVDLVIHSYHDSRLDTAEFMVRGQKSLVALRELEQEPNLPAAHLAARYNARGPNFNCLTACAASSQAIGEAAEIIHRGQADMMIAGGCHSMIHPFGLTGFNLLTALSTRNDQPEKASRPFDRLRDGFVLGEGSAILILEELEHALSRSARIHAEIVGYGSSADAFRVTDVHPEGRGAKISVRRALEDAGLSPEEIHYINAHGTSTRVNDRVETTAIKDAFGDYAYKCPMSSTKSMMGHLIAAAGAAELICCILAIRTKMLPPTINYENPDPDCDLDYVPNKPRKAEVSVAMSNSFGFGGQNITLIVRQYTGR